MHWCLQRFSIAQLLQWVYIEEQCAAGGVHLPTHIAKIATLTAESSVFKYMMYDVLCYLVRARSHAIFRIIIHLPVCSIYWVYNRTCYLSCETRPHYILLHNTWVEHQWMGGAWTYFPHPRTRKYYYILYSVSDYWSGRRDYVRCVTMCLSNNSQRASKAARAMWHGDYDAPSFAH
jgi:hypothetical protein